MVRTWLTVDNSIDAALVCPTFGRHQGRPWPAQGPHPVRTWPASGRHLVRTRAAIGTASAPWIARSADRRALAHLVSLARNS
jgi:hypothetical protein